MNSKNYIFFVSCAKGLEQVLLFEIKQKVEIFFKDEKIENYKIHKGGIEVECSLYLGCSLNDVLKTATRILLRVDTFKVRDFPKFYNKCLKIRWNDFLRGQIPGIEVSSFKSRVFDSRKIESSLIKAIKDNYQRQAPKKKYLETIDQLPKSSVYVRLENDECTISVDLSGERLDLRGKKLLTSKAPIRESIACALLLLLKKHTSKSSNLLDLMCGSGSFTSEAKDYFKLSSNRDYYYKWLPLFLRLQQKKKEVCEESLFSSFVLNEIDEKTFTSVKENIDSENTTFLNKDYFSLTNKEVPNNSTLILNPPYGKRIKTEIPTKDFYKNIIKHTQDVLKIETFGIIIPDELGTFKFKNRVLEKVSFENGGYPVTYYVTGP